MFTDQRVLKLADFGLAIDLNEERAVRSCRRGRVSCLWGEGPEGWLELADFGLAIDLNEERAVRRREGGERVAPPVCSPGSRDGALTAQTRSQA